MILLDGKQTALHIQQDIAESVAKRVEQGLRPPHLAAMLVGEDAPSLAYVNQKVKACKRVGFESSLIPYPVEVSQQELIEKIRSINEDPQIDGLIVQLPLPDHIDVVQITETISPEKDVDGFHPINVGRMAKNLPAYISATPLGILKLLEHYQIETQGKHCVVLGRSDIVGSPMSILMSRKSKIGNCTVTICHSRTPDLKEHTLQADILIVALGKTELVKKDMVKPGAIVIDVGINRVEDASKKRGYRLVGDVAFAEVSEVASHITPVPGGVGPMTVTGLLYNTLLSAEKKIYS